MKRILLALLLLIELLASSDRVQQTLANQTEPTLPAQKPKLSGTDIGIVGLRFVYTDQHTCEISEVQPDAPAAKAQLRKGDAIREVNDVPTKDLGKDRIYQMLVGEPNTSVKIKICRGNTTFVKTLHRMKLQNLSKAHPDIVQAYLLSQDVLVQAEVKVRLIDQSAANEEWVRGVQQRLQRSWDSLATADTNARLGTDHKRTLVTTFLVDTSGELVKLHFDHSTGNATLDESAMKAIRNAAPYTGLAVDRVSIEATFNFTVPSLPGSGLRPHTTPSF